MPGPEHEKAADLERQLSETAEPAEPLPLGAAAVISDREGDPRDEIDAAEDALHDDPEKEEIKVAGSRSGLQQVKSSATDTSVTTTATAATNHERNQPKTWKQKLNPMRWGATPPVPKERLPSREHEAGFFSKLIFQWQASLMAVS